ncbi:ATP-binding protein [Actinophytocola glycyrrhizae]|uniref:Signal transduction histidine-protein kinase/phosphatase MprB n=1 Tax=Actinophytocola glycyrrhizae TaxID=2044873 RepID=A0ABV9RY43_9PSEU
MTLWWGLRARLFAAAVVLVVLTAAGVAGAMYVQARNEILQRSQDAAVESLLSGLRAQLPLHTLPPTDYQLVTLADVLSNRTDTAAATYGGRWFGGLPREGVPAELRAAVDRGRVAWQRIDSGGFTGLITGTRVGGTGLAVYSYRSLNPEERSIDGLAARAWLIGGCALVVAVLLALTAAEGVLGPVRELRRAAARLGAGDLSARVPVRGTDELAGVSTTFNDTAQALQHHVGELRRMESEARRFVADVSHELRTPLAAMTAVTDVLDEEAASLPPDTAEAARLVSQETKNLTRLVTDLVEITRFDSGRAPLLTDEVDVAAAITATLSSRGWLDRVETTLPPGITAHLDARRLDVIIANLVSNALTHGAAPVRVALTADERRLIIQVSDEGPGLPPTVLPHVFNRFYKADTARTRSPGSGLGLAIARENAHLHGGTLTASNATGAVFTLTLPRGGA